MTPVLMTERLLLRPFEHEDANALAALLNDPAVAQGICSVPHPFTPLHASARILMMRAREMAGTDFGWAVEYTDGALIGFLSLTKREQGVAGLGYAYARSHWGRGLATEALQAVLDWAGRALGLREV